MPIELAGDPAMLAEELPRLTLGAAAKQFPTDDGRHVSGATVWRWATTGSLNLATGQRVKLEAFHIGWRLYTTQAAIGRYIARLNSQEIPLQRATTPRQREKQKAAAVRELAAAGWMDKPATVVTDPHAA